VGDAVLSEALAALVSEPLRGAVPYHVPAPPVVRAKLDANELPAALPEEYRAGLAAAVAGVALERYPDAGARRLREVLAREAPGSSLVLGNGSDELILVLCEAFAAARPGATVARVLYPVPSFVYYRIACHSRGVEQVEVPLERDFTLSMAAVERALVERRPNVCFFALPNNPTGTLWPMAAIADLARRNPDVVVVSDEAYVAYSGETLVGEVGGGLPNLVVMRTLSKIGLAGLRVGYMFASPAVAAVCERVRPPYNVGSANQAAAAWLLENAGEWIKARTAEVVAERPRLAAMLAAIEGVTVFPSAANLLLVRIAGDGRAHAAWQTLQDRGVLVRDFDRPGPLAGCLRITVGTSAENDLVAAELRAALA
jgi:histidinol-phosphate aminotransferase